MTISIANYLFLFTWTFFVAHRVLHEQYLTLYAPLDAAISSDDISGGVS